MPLVKAKKPEIDSAISFRDDDWVIPKAKKTEFKAIDWVKNHQTELEKKVMQHADFVDACGKANSNPLQEFRGLMQKFASPPDEYWQNFDKTFERGVSTQLAFKHPLGAMLTGEATTENMLFDSFARMIKKPLVMTI